MSGTAFDIGRVHPEGGEHVLLAHASEDFEEAPGG